MKDIDTEYYSLHRDLVPGTITFPLDHKIKYGAQFRHTLWIKTFEQHYDRYDEEFLLHTEEAIEELAKVESCLGRTHEAAMLNIYGPRGFVPYHTDGVIEMAIVSYGMPGRFSIVEYDKDINPIKGTEKTWVVNNGDVFVGKPGFNDRFMHKIINDNYRQSLVLRSGFTDVSYDFDLSRR